ncbi:hypothetical protein [Altererythrobacter litoralis]|uniref:Uncharacterized protein n=1 Tax=Altererythrobacter litoralis TaxID=3113904 RepID=A0ABU7GFQ1_9SPHN|nr:hypothetical protein [Erythrobacteraceae bacterium 1XM1-14]
MDKREAKFRTGIVSAFAFFWVAATVGFYFLPASPHGRMSKVLRTDEGFTIIGGVVFSIFCVFSLIALFSAIRACLGWPAISYNGKVLKEYVVPLRRIPISDVERIEVRSKDALLHLKSGGKRTVNARLVQNHEAFFNRVILD